MKTLKIVGKGEYGEIISRYFQAGLPKVAKINKDDLLEILSDLLVGSREYRYGPTPKVESLYTIRQTISKAIELNAPIPILVPWGGRKLKPELSIDITEVSALRQLIAVDEVIKQFFPPGLHIHIRIEDLGANWIYRVDDTDLAIERYSSDMVRLINAIKGSTSMEAIRESKLMDRKEYFALSEKYSELIEEVVRVLKAYKDLDINTIPEFVKLKEMGWKGEIDPNQQKYYTDRYRRLYPGRKEAEYDLMLADYLGGSKARYDLKGRGEPDNVVGSYVQITFVPPVPGAPKSMFANTLYYRTIPESSARTHVAPWRGIGYLELLGDSSIPKITTSMDIQMEENDVHLIDGDDENPLVIKANYRFTIYATPALFGGFPMTA